MNTKTHNIINIELNGTPIAIDFDDGVAVWFDDETIISVWIGE